MIDLHCHMLPAVDDGPPDAETAVAMARAQLDAGVSCVVTTPHVSDLLPNDAATVRRGVTRLREDLAAAGVPLDVLPGAEVSLARAIQLDDAELGALTLGGGPWLLVEAPLRPIAGVEPLVAELQRRGHRVVLGHPERSPTFHRDPQLLRRLVRAGALTQVTAAALTGRFGRTPQRFGAWMADERLLHVVASDAHDLSARPPGLSDPIEIAGLSAWLDWLTAEVPRAILTDDLIPPLRAPVRRGRLRSRLAAAARLVRS